MEGLGQMMSSLHWRNSNMSSRHVEAAQVLHSSKRIKRRASRLGMQLLQLEGLQACRV